MGQAKIFADNIRKLREAKKLARSQAAQKLGISSQQLWFYEAGKTQPRLNVLVKMCDLYGFQDIYRILTIEI